MLTAAVRDLHRAYPGRFVTDVRTAAEQIWESNPHITKLDASDPRVRIIEMQYPSVHQSNRRPYHFIHGFVQYLEQTLELRIPITEFRGDIHLADIEKKWISQVAETGHSGPFWIIVAGGKYDFTAKWWDPNAYQAVVDHFRGQIQFVQCGEASHWHTPLNGVLNLVGKTDLRQFIRLMYHAQGVICPVTFAMHLAAAVEPGPNCPKNRPCIVIAGGREPPHWEAYPFHQYLSTVGMLPCCAEGACWKSRCQLVGDGDAKDQTNVCVDAVSLSETLRIPRCMHMISAADVIRKLEMYAAGGVLTR